MDDRQLWLYGRVFIDGCNYVKMAFGHDKASTDALKNALYELWQKLMSVQLEVEKVKVSWRQTEIQLHQVAQKGTGGVIAGGLRTEIENFLTQGKGALDILANQFLRHAVQFDRKFHHKRITTHLKGQSDLDAGAVQEIESLLNDTWDAWLEDFTQDRDLHHDRLLELSAVRLVDGKARATITRRNGTTDPDPLGYVDRQYAALCDLVAELIRLICATKVPGLRAIRFDGYRTIKDELARGQFHASQPVENPPW